MSDDLLVKDFSWDDEANVDLTPPSGKKHFAHLRMYPLAVTKSFVAGDFVTVPSVVGGDFNDKDTKGDMKLKGWKEGGTTRLFVLVATQTAQDGNSYQIVKQYASKLFNKKEKIHTWAELVKPALQSLNAKKLVDEGVYVEFDEIPTGQVFESDEGNKDIVYWGNYKTYASKEELDKASEEFFSDIGEKGTKEDFWPASWVESNSVQDMIDHAKTVEGTHAEIAQSLMLNDAKTVDGEDVNISLVLSKCLDVPEPMIQL